MDIREITDKNKWEKFIADNSPQALFQSWNWGEVIKKTQNFWRLGIYDGENLVGIAQVSKVLAKRGNFLHIRHGPVFSDWNKYYFDAFFKYLNELAKKEKVIFLRISPLVENSGEFNAFIRKYGFIDAPVHAMDGEFCWLVDLTGSEEEILASMRKTTRYLIRQGQKLQINIVKSKNISDINEFLNLYKKTAKRQHFVEHKGIREEFERFLKDDQILLFMGYYQNKLISCALIIFYNNQAIYHHSASIEQKIPVNYLLQWEVIKEAKKRGMKIYNMWGITPPGKPRHPWKGLTIFKQGFGGKVVEYMHAKDLPLSSLYCATYTIDWLRKLRKGY